MAKSLREGEIEELKTRADIQSIISGYVNLKRAGKSYTGLCPFHKEKTPSFSVDPGKQLYHCFGCGEGGDVISFIMKVENLDFIEAAEFIAKKINYNLQYIHTDAPEITEKRSRLVELNDLARKYYSYVLFNSKTAASAMQYLEGRGFNRETISQFEVGYSIDSWDNFSNFAIKRGFKPKELVDSGLAIQSTRGASEVYDRFRGRIMFPIRDLVGKTVGFGARILSQDSRAVKKQANLAQPAKYINTPETRIYSKSKNIYGLFDAKNSIVETDQAIIVEGYTDVMALHQSGIKNAVASCGTALTSEQVGVLGRFTKNVVLVFDSDNAGVSASLKGMDRLKDYNERLDLYIEGNIDMKVAVLEEGYDPADFVIKRGKDAFVAALEKASNIIDFTIAMILKKHKIENLGEKLRATDELVSFIATLSSKIVQEECIKKISEKLNLREALLIEQLVKKIRTMSSASSYAGQASTTGAGAGNLISPDFTNREHLQGKMQEGAGNAGQATDSIYSGITPAKNLEIEALKILINGLGQDFEKLCNIGAEYFKYDDTRRLYEIVRNTIAEVQGKNNPINFPLEISSNKLEGEQVKKLYNLVQFSPLNYSDYNLACREVLYNIKRLYLSDRAEETRQQLKKLENYNKKFRELANNLNNPESSKEYILKKEKIDNRIKELTHRLSEIEAEKRKYLL
jgi:DNA primase